MKRVSVLIAAFAADEFIEDVVASVLSQQLPENYTLDLFIGVDGCSKTWKVVKTLNHENVHCLKMKENRGTYVTFNTMLNYVNADIIVRFDADDIMLENYLKTQLELLESDENIHITRTWSIYTNLEQQAIKTQLGDGTFTSDKGERRKGSDGQMMIRREVLDNLGAFKAWPCSADTDFLMRAGFYGFNLVEVEQFLYFRRVHENSLTQRKETGVNSTIREGYNDIMRSNSRSGISKNDCWVDPVIGEVEVVLENHAITA